MNKGTDLKEFEKISDELGGLKFSASSVKDIKKAFSVAKETAYNIKDAALLDFCLKELINVEDNELEAFYENPNDKSKFESAKDEFELVLRDCMRGGLD